MNVNSKAVVTYCNVYYALMRNINNLISYRTVFLEIPMVNRECEIAITIYGITNRLEFGSIQVHSVLEIGMFDREGPM